MSSGKKTTDLVIIPSGAFEVYGPHLPLGTDTLVANKIAGLVAERVNAIIGPVLEAGESSELEDFPGTITISSESFKQYLWDTLRSLEKWGFKDFLFVNTHLGNVPIINQIAFEFQRRPASAVHKSTIGDLLRRTATALSNPASWHTLTPAKRERRL